MARNRRTLGMKSHGQAADLGEPRRNPMRKVRAAIIPAITALGVAGVLLGSAAGPAVAAGHSGAVHVQATGKMFYHG
jgi:hypothetical protein